MPVGRFGFLGTTSRRSVEHSQYQPVCHLGSTRVAEGQEKPVGSTEEGGMLQPDEAHGTTLRSSVI